MPVVIDQLNQYLQAIFVPTVLNRAGTSMDDTNQPNKNMTSHQNICAQWQDFVAQHAVVSLSQPQLIQYMLSESII